MSPVRNAPTHRVGAARRWPDRAVVGGLLAAVLVGFGGCTGPAGNAPGPEQPGVPGESAAPSATPARSLPRGVTPAPIPTKVANDPNDRKNVVMTGCEAAKGGWQATGTATNPGKKEVSYRITVFFTTTAATTVDSARTEIDVKAGETIKWSAKQEFAAPKEMLCVLRGVDAA